MYCAVLRSEWARVRGVGAGEWNSVAACEWQQRRQCADTGEDRQDRVTRTGSEVCSRAAARVRGRDTKQYAPKDEGWDSVASPAPRASQAPSTRYATSLPVNVISLYQWGSGGERARLAPAANYCMDAMWSMGNVEVL